MEQSFLHTDLTHGRDWLPDWLWKQALTKPAQVALWHRDGVLDYQSLYQVARTFGALLHDAAGIQRGDRVAVLARHGLSYAKAVHGIMQAGAILVPLNTRLTSEEIGWQLNNVSASLVITDEEHRGMAEDAWTAASQLDNAGDSSDRSRKNSVWVLERSGKLNGKHLDTGSSDVPDVQSQTLIRLENVHAIVHTSGTTGYPKGVQITYGNHFWSATASALQLGLDADERWLVPMPLFHVGGLAVLMRSLIYGTTAVLHDTFDIERVNDALSDDDITLVSVVPTMLQRMLTDERRRAPNKRLRCILLGGSGASETLLRRCQEEGLPVAQSYGLTEANSQVATLKPKDALRKLGSSGQPLFPTVLRVVGERGEMSRGEAGELWVHGPTVTPGYWQREDANRDTFVDGWLRTGDIGYVDDEGYLYVLDRRRDLIVSGGENVYPAEIEKVLESHQAVLEAGVAPTEDVEWGQVPVAFVVPKSGCSVTPEELGTFCRSRMAGYKVPKHWRIVEQLPRNASGKLLRRQLVEWVKEQ